MSTPATPKAERPAPRWNDDPAWLTYIAALETRIKKITAKYSQDRGLREDCAQMARIGLHRTFPERVNGHAEYQAGTLDQATWDKRLAAYCGNVIRNCVLKHLESPTQGSLYHGRTRRVKDPVTGERSKVHSPATCSSLDHLLDEAGLQVDTSGRVSWDATSTAGLAGS